MNHTVNDRYSSSARDRNNNKLQEKRNSSNNSNLNTETSATSTEKILGPPIKNEIGEQNCFINVLIHAVYHTEELRKFFLVENINKEDKKLNLFYELQVMDKFSKVSSKLIDPNPLREELANLFKEDRKFSLNSMDDPVEALFVILNAFHAFSLSVSSLKYIIDKPCNPPCLSHSLCWINILEQFQCECGATSEVLKYDYNYFIFEAYVKEILTFTASVKEISKYKNKFFQYVKGLNAKCDNDCPEKCSRNNVRRNLYLLNSTPYLFFNLVWRETNPKLTDICKLFFMMPLKFHNRDLFELADKSNNSSYELYGMVCYWGSHYICFFKTESSDGSYWVSYDDTIITKIPTWKDLIVRCLRSHFHPTILFYRKKIETSYSEISSMKDQISEIELEKIMNYCINYDKESLNPYKNDELDSNRLRPSTSDKKKSENGFTLIKSNDEYSTLNTEMSHKDPREEIKLNKSDLALKEENTNMTFLKELKNEKLINDKVDNNEDYLSHLKDDEWICENTSCKNINNNTNYECLKCRKINNNIHDLIIQRNYYTKKEKAINQQNINNSQKLELNNSIARKRDQSMPSRSNNILNSSKIKEDSNNVNHYDIICDNCGFTNLKTKTFCSKCSKVLKKLTKAKPNDEDLYSHNRSNISVLDNNKKWMCPDCGKQNLQKESYCNYCIINRNNVKSNYKFEESNLDRYNINQSSNVGIKRLCKFCKISSYGSECTICNRPLLEFESTKVNNSISNSFKNTSSNSYANYLNSNKNNGKPMSLISNQPGKTVDTSTKLVTSSQTFGNSGLKSPTFTNSLFKINSQQPQAIKNTYNNPSMTHNYPSNIKNTSNNIDAKYGIRDSREIEKPNTLMRSNRSSSTRPTTGFNPRSSSIYLGRK